METTLRNRKAPDSITALRPNKDTGGVKVVKNPVKVLVKLG